MRYAPLLRVIITLLLTFFTFLFSASDFSSIKTYAQESVANKTEESDEEKKDRITSERFLDLLKKKPRLGIPGTAE